MSNRCYCAYCSVFRGIPREEIGYCRFHKKYVDSDKVCIHFKMAEVKTCEMCKHNRWFGEYSMQVCEMRGLSNPREVCGYYEKRGGEA